MYPYTMRHGKYFDETIFFFFLYGDRCPPPARRYIYIYIYSLSESMTRDDESLFCRRVLFVEHLLNRRERFETNR